MMLLCLFTPLTFLQQFFYELPSPARCTAFVSGRT